MYQPFSYNVVCFPQETNWKSTNCCWVSKMKSDLDAKESSLVWCKMVSNFVLFCFVSSKCRYLRIVKEKKTKKKKKKKRPCQVPNVFLQDVLNSTTLYLITHKSGPKLKQCFFFNLFWDCKLFICGKCPKLQNFCFLSWPNQKWLIGTHPPLAIPTMVSNKFQPVWLLCPSIWTPTPLHQRKPIWVLQTNLLIWFLVLLSLRDRFQLLSKKPIQVNKRIAQKTKGNQVKMTLDELLLNWSNLRNLTLWGFVLWQLF